MTVPTVERISRTPIETGSGPAKGCFLLHGLTGSTYEIQGLADYLAAAGYRVSAPLLAGHGSSLDELAVTSAQDWLEETEYQLTELILECEQVVVMGLSMGASLALNLAGLFDVAGVVVISGAVLLPRRALRIMLPLLARLNYIVKKRSMYGDSQIERQPIYGYPAYPLRAVQEFGRLNRYTRKRLSRVHAPALILHSHADATADMTNAHYIYDGIGSTDKELVEFQRSSHVMPADCEKEAVWAAIGKFVQRVMPE